MSLFQQIRGFFSGKEKEESQLKTTQPSAIAHTQSEIPPQDFVDLVGGGDFKGVGEEFFTYFIDLGLLRPDDRVLDIGCGVGRMARPLINYLDNRGSYEGFDIVKEMVDWCKVNISQRYPNFNFQVTDIYNSCYNPLGKYKGTDYRFPFSDKEFDFIFLTSVFTHMLPSEMENYLSEIARTLKTGGRCLVTFFMLDETVHQLIKDKKSTFQFNFKREDCSVEKEDVPEEVVAFEENRLKSLFEKYSLDVESIHFGSWSGRSDFLSFQDIIVLKKAT